MNRPFESGDEEAISAGEAQVAPRASADPSATDAQADRSVVFLRALRALRGESASSAGGIAIAKAEFPKDHAHETTAYPVRPLPSRAFVRRSRSRESDSPIKAPTSPKTTVKTE